MLGRLTEFRQVINVTTSLKITEGVYSTGELGTVIKEQSLIIDSEKGLIIITGCAHHGIVDIIKTAKELMNKKAYLAVGGFHHPSTAVIKKFKELDVEKAAPSHCTGDQAVQVFAEEYKEWEEERFFIPWQREYKNQYGKFIL